MQESSAPQKPIWESAEDIAIREKKLAEMEVRRLEHELAASRQELFNERREEKERQKRRDNELSSEAFSSGGKGGDKQGPPAARGAHCE